MHRNIISFCMLAFVLLTPALMPGLSEANVYIGPDSTEVRLKPGEKGAAVFDVANLSDQDMNITVEAVNWLVELLAREGDLNDVYEWIDFGEYRNFVAPKKTHSKLTVDLVAPQNFLGERVAQVFFAYSPVNPTPEQQRTAEMITQRIGLLLFLGAEGTEKFKVDIKMDTVNTKLTADSTYNIVAGYSVRNQGNIHARLRGKLKVMRKDEVIVSRDLGVVRGLYAEEERTYVASIEGAPLDPGRYTLMLDLTVTSYEMKKNISASQKIKIEKQTGNK